jgi:molybdate transport system substrate-binding protein
MRWINSRLALSSFEGFPFSKLMPLIRHSEQCISVAWIECLVSPSQALVGRLPIRVSSAHYFFPPCVPATLSACPGSLQFGSPNFYARCFELKLSGMLKPLCRMAIALVLSFGSVPVADAQETVTVFAAASLQDALNDAAAKFTNATGIKVRFYFGATSILARQIEEGAPADLFASADVDWMDYLAQGYLIKAQTRVNLLSNRLVMVAPKSSPTNELKLDTASIKAALEGGRIATGAVETRHGHYAKMALEKLGLWTALQTDIAPAENARAALESVARGEAPLGIVYATDAASEAGVKVVATFPRDAHPAIIYPFAIVSGSKEGGAERFLTFLQGPVARQIFAIQGFSFAD